MDRAPSDLRTESRDDKKLDACQALTKLNSDVHELQFGTMNSFGARKKESLHRGTTFGKESESRGSQGTAMFRKSNVSGFGQGGNHIGRVSMNIQDEVEDENLSNALLEEDEGTVESYKLNVVKETK